MRWVLVSLLTWGLSFSAAATDWREETELWRSAEISSSVGHFINNRKCYADAEWFYSCINALNRAGTLLPLPYRIGFSHHHDIQVERKPVVDGASSWQTIFSTRQEEAARLRSESALYFWRSRKSASEERFDFESQLARLAAELPRSIPTQMLLGYAINGHLATYDAHAYVMPAAMLEQWHRQSQNVFTGIGVNLDFLTDGIFVHQVFPNSPAAAAGIHDDDRVLAIAANGVHFLKVEGLSPERIFELLRGPDQSTIALKIQRGLEILHVQLKRAPVHVPVTWTARPEPLTGYVALRSLQSLESCQAVHQRFRELERAGVKRFILDLRGNQGGGTSQAICVASLFVGAKRVVGTQSVSINIPSLIGLLPPEIDRRREISWSRGDTAMAFAQPLVVLVDAFSASAAEIVAGAIQFHRQNAWLVGERTAGKGTVQMPDSPLDNSSIKVAHTISRFYLADGRSNQLAGVTPNFVVPLRRRTLGQNRYYPREGELFPNPLRAVQTAQWRDPRAAEASRVRGCVEARPIEEQDQDFQKAYGLAVLNCL